MSMRLRMALVGVATVLIFALWFFAMFRPNQNRIAELRDQQEVTRQDISRLQAELARLQELQRQEPQLRAELARMQDALPDDPRIPDFILQVHEAANLAGIEFLSITPSLPTAFTPPGDVAAPEGLQMISVTISTTGTFFSLEDFIIRMERLRRALRINSFTLAPGGEEVAPGASPNMSVSFSLQMFVNAPVAVAPPPDPAAEGAPAPEPAPDEGL